MASGYRNSAGVDFDDLFEAGTTQAAGYRLVGGGALQYAARGSVAKIADVGYRDAAGVDLSNLWLPKGSAPPVLGFNGQSYGATATAPSGATGTTSAQLSLNINNDGTWTIFRTITGTNNPGNTQIASGTWLPAGQAVANYEVQFTGTQPSGTTLTNGAPSYVSCSTSRSISLRAQVNSATIDFVSGSSAIGCLLRRVGAGASASNCTLSVTAQGQV